MPKYIYGKEVKNGFELAVENMLSVHSGADCVGNEEDVLPSPTLFDKFWHKGEMAVLLGECGVGKSTLAVQIANSISKGEAMAGFSAGESKQKVLFFDVGLSDVQFFYRYAVDGKYTFDENFVRVAINPLYREPANFGSVLFTAMENAIQNSGAQVLVIDSIAALKGLCCYYPREELRLAQQISRLQKKYNLSMLLVAEVRSVQNAGRLLMKNMDGIRFWGGFVDSVFAVGYSRSDADGRYLMQLRSTERMVYTADNVVACQLRQQGKSLFFVYVGKGTERQFLQTPLCEPDASILSLKTAQPHLSLGEIANQLETNKMRVKRVLEKFGYTTSTHTEP